MFLILYKIIPSSSLQPSLFYIINILSIFITLLILAYVNKVAEKINISLHPNFKRNNELSYWNWIGLIIGAPFTIINVKNSIYFLSNI
jgi:hypothetical protein